MGRLSLWICVFVTVSVCVRVFLWLLLGLDVATLLFPFHLWSKCLCYLQINQVLLKIEFFLCCNTQNFNAAVFKLRIRIHTRECTSYSRSQHKCHSHANINELCKYWACKTIIHRVSKNNVPSLACYNFETHEWILIFFGRNVTDKVGNQKSLYYATSSNLCFCTTWQNGEMRKSHFHSVGLC